MPLRARRVAGILAVVALAAVARPSTQLPAWATECPEALPRPGFGNLYGAAEQPIADLVHLARAAEAKAMGTVATGVGVISEAEKDTARTWLGRSIEAIDAAVNCTNTASGLQEFTQTKGALADLAFARRSDAAQLARIAPERTPIVSRLSFLLALSKADRAKARALLQLQGIRLGRGEDPQRYLSDEPTRPELEKVQLSFETKADRNPTTRRGARLDGRARKAVKKGVRRRRRRSASDDVTRYLAIFAPPGVEDASGFLSLERDLRGPFEVRCAAGNFEASPGDATYLGSTAFAGFELDVRGSDPLEFFSVGVRYVVNDAAGTSKGVQVFANSRGAARGNRYIEGEQQVDVRVTFRGGVFRASVKPAGAPDAEYVEFAAYDRGTPDEVWVAGIGGANFSGKRVLGVDDFVIEPIGP